MRLTPSLALPLLAVLFSMALIGCDKTSSSSTPAPAQDSQTTATPTPPSGPGAMPAVTVDLTPPAVKMTPLHFKIDDLACTIDAPEGAVVKDGFSGTTITQGDEFGFTLSFGKNKFLDDADWWEKGGGFLKPKGVAVDNDREFLVESTETGPARFSASACASTPYIDFTLKGAKKGDMGAFLKNLQGLKNLTVLELTGTDVNDDGLAGISGLDQLQTLYLSSTAITDAGLQHLKTLKNLKELHLANTSVSDAGLVNLQGMTNLETLSLIKTKVTDAGLPALTGLKKVLSLYVSDTAVTDAGKAKYEKARDGE